MFESIDMDSSQIERLQGQVLAITREKRRRCYVYSYVCNIFHKARFFNRIRHLGVKLYESAEKIRKAAQQVQHLS